MIFPNRVWEPTGKYTRDGKPMWASRDVDVEDRKRRRDLAILYARRQYERQQAERAAA